MDGREARRAAEAGCRVAVERRRLAAPLELVVVIAERGGETRRQPVRFLAPSGAAPRDCALAARGEDAKA